MRGLGLADIEEYRAYLDAHDDEWTTLEGLLPITISRFFRERDVFAHLCDTALPQLRSLAAPGPVRIWSAGCAGGEEVYTLSIAAHRLQIPIRLLGTDVDEHQLRRAGDACYSLGSLKDLPTEWRDYAFEARGSKFCLRPEFREHVEFRLRSPTSTKMCSEGLPRSSTTESHREAWWCSANTNRGPPRLRASPK
jgi:chemotaxis protein methyltransferase CheR